MGQEDTRPLYIRLSRWAGATPASGEGSYVSVFNKVYEVRGFVLLSESFLNTKAEAMRIVRDVSKRAHGIDNNARELINASVGRIARDASWTLRNVRDESVGATASLLEAARDMLSLRSDLGKSWRSGPTVAMIQRTASTAALDFITEELIRPGSGEV